MNTNTINTCTTVRTRSFQFSLTALFLALLGLLLVAARPAHAADEKRFNLLDSTTGAIQQSWKISSFTWGPSTAQTSPNSFSIDWQSNPAHSDLTKALQQGAKVADASIIIYGANQKLVAVCTFKHLLVTATSSFEESGISMASATLTFQKVTITFVDDNGDPGMSWDRVENL